MNTALPVLRATGLTAFHGPAQALFGLDFELRAGEVLALVGRNGAGKSTTLKALMGLVRAGGEVMFEGRHIEPLASFERARLGIGYVPEDRRLFAGLTVRENLQVGSQGKPYDFEALLALFPNLRVLLDRPAVQMSGGEQQMLAVARTLAASPRAILLDEPSEGIAPRLVMALAQAVLGLRARGVAVLLSEQNPHFVARTADRALLIDRGRLAGELPAAELARPGPAVRAVLGL